MSPINRYFDIIREALRFNGTINFKNNVFDEEGICIVAIKLDDLYPIAVEKEGKEWNSDYWSLELYKSIVDELEKEGYVSFS